MPRSCPIRVHVHVHVHVMCMCMSTCQCMCMCIGSSGRTRFNSEFRVQSLFELKTANRLSWPYKPCLASRQLTTSSTLSTVNKEINSPKSAPPPSFHAHPHRAVPWVHPIKGAPHRHPSPPSTPPALTPTVGTRRSIARDRPCPHPSLLCPPCLCVCDASLF
jgi:hypothetical protein